MNLKPDNKRFPEKGRRRKSPDQDYWSKAASRRLSPTKFLQDQGGIEGIFHEAARGFYNRGEIWGVAKALRGAVQGLQSGSNSPRGATGRWRGGLQEDTIALDDSSRLSTRIRALEQRNQALAKMLQNAVEDLWIQQQKLHQDEAGSAADAVSLAVAKVQFVQVYLENPSMPFPAETPEESEAAQFPSIARHGADEASGENAHPLGEAPDSRFDAHPADNQPPTRAIRPTLEHRPQPPSAENALGTIPAVDAGRLTAHGDRASDRPGPSPFQRPRASLRHSSFSWMLGEDQRQSSFVSASPFPSEKRMARGKAGFLFGDDQGDASVHAVRAKGKVDGDCPDETITLDCLKGAVSMES